MELNNLAELLAISRDVTVTGLLLVALWGTYKGWLVPGWVYRQSLDNEDRLRRERDDFKNELFDTVGLATRSVTMAERAATRAEFLASPSLRTEIERDLRQRPR